MTLDDLANLGEIVGAIAVLVTLIYLAIQIRQGPAATRAQTRQALADSQIAYLNSRALDPFVRVASMKMQAGEKLNDEEAYALRFHLIAHIRLFENYFTQYALGTMDASDWTAMQHVMTAQFQLAPYRDAFFIAKTCGTRSLRKRSEKSSGLSTSRTCNKLRLWR